VLDREDKSLRRILERRSGRYVNDDLADDMLGHMGVGPVAATVVEDVDWDEELSELEDVIDVEPIDPPGDLPDRGAPKLPRADRESRPVLPAWLDAPKAAVKQRCRDLKHDVKFHATRAPSYAGRAVKYAPAGVGRTYRGLYRWATDYESAPARYLEAQRGNTSAYLALAQQRDERVHDRRFLAMGLGCLLPLTVLAVWFGLTGPELPGQTRLVAFVAALVTVVVLGHIGAPEDKPIVESAAAGPARRRITWSMLRAAFEAEGVKLSKARPDGAPADPAREMTLVREISRDARDTGYVATIDLPLGKTAADAMAKRDKIASGLSVSRAQVHITPDADSERRINIYVADVDPFTRPRRVSPLASLRQLDFWEGFDFGTNAKGEPVRLKLVWTHLLVAAIPRMGKSYAALIAACAAALDPRVRIIILNGKKGAWRHLAKVCHRYVAGARDEAVLYVLRTLRECKADIDARGDRIEELDEKYGYGDKLVPQVASDPSQGMPLVAIFIDEAQRYIGHGQYGGEILALLKDIAKVGPSAGYMLIVAVQKPTGDVIDTDLRDNMGLRYVLRMKTSAGSKAALGEITPGFDPVQFSDRHKGVGVLDGSDNEEESLDGADIDIVRTDSLDMAMVEEIADRAHAVRTGMNKLSGYAAGDDLSEESTPFLLLDHLSDAIKLGEDKVWSADLIRRIADSHPEAYDGWSPDDLANHLKPYGVETIQISRTVTDPETGVKRQKNWRGVAVADLTEAYNREMAKRAALGQ
jgi:S-DNA-T family DNA segregation ATPase FtsK/SpoIIIE